MARPERVEAVSRVGVAFISDRDGHIPDCSASFWQNIPAGPMRAMPATVIDDRDHRLGMSGAVNAAWDWARSKNLDYLIHVEEDFRFVAPFNPDEAIAVLNADPRLAQVVLKRQPWSPEEHRAGGIIECHPDDYTDHKDGDLRWVSHQRIFSLNPCVIPRHILEMSYPAGNEAEMTDLLVALGYRFAFLGERSDPHRVEHVGYERGIGWRL